MYRSLWWVLATGCLVSGCELFFTPDRYYTPDHGGAHASMGGAAGLARDAGAGGAVAGGRTSVEPRYPDAASGTSGSAQGGSKGTSRDSGATGSVDAEIDAGMGGGSGGATSPSDAATDGDSGSTVPSCRSMSSTDCHGTDCCASATLLGGPFPMGRGASGTDAFPGASGVEQPEHTVTVSRFRLDVFEVTVGRFRRFFDAYDGHPAKNGEGMNPSIRNSGWQSAWDSLLPPDKAHLDEALACGNYSTWAPMPSAGDTHPINCVTWFEAFAFCAWDGGWLPTEAEWEYAAAGGMENRLYPWGSTSPTPQNALASLDCAFGGSTNTCNREDLPPVGSCGSGVGAFGQYDLAGSVDEWVLDLWDAGFYTTAAATGVNVANLGGGSDDDHVIRGGDFVRPSDQLRAAMRLHQQALTRSHQVGFRCARSQ